MRKINLKSINGVTLIALVITIIVLLILAGVSIAMLTGDNGILTQVNKAKGQTVNEGLKEEIQLAITSKKMLDKVNKSGNLEKELKKIDNVVVEKLANDTYSVKRDNTEYTIYEDGTIIEGKLKVWDGAEEEPVKLSDTEYNIENANQLKWLSNRVNEGNNFSGNTIYLKKDIDLGGRKNNDDNWNGIQWTPIGSPENPFSGTFNGENHTIYGIYIENTESYQALFGKIANAQVMNIKIEKGYIKANQKIGSIVGINAGEIINCYNRCEISGNQFIGGITGFNNGNIRKCTNDGNIISKLKTNTEYRYIGGIAGRHNGKIIEKSCNNGTIEGNGYGVGGIAGYIYAYAIKIESCYNTGSIKGELLHTGGIVGDNYSSKSIINNCYNTATIVGGSSVGGIAGRNSGTISNSYNIGNIKGNGDNIKGIAGSEVATIINSYYKAGCVDTTIAEQEKSDEFMKTIEFSELLNKEQAKNIWIQVKGNYPKLNI